MPAPSHLIFAKYSSGTILVISCSLVMITSSYAMGRQCIWGEQRAVQSSMLYSAIGAVLGFVHLWKARCLVEN